MFHFQLVPVASGSTEKQWVRTKPFQHHTHDVRTVAHSPTALISGGELCHFTLPSTGCIHAELVLILHTFCSCCRHRHPLSNSSSHGEGGGKELRCCSPENHLSPCKYYLLLPVPLLCSSCPWPVLGFFLSVLCLLFIPSCLPGTSSGRLGQVGQEICILEKSFFLYYFWGNHNPLQTAVV